MYYVAAAKEITSQQCNLILLPKTEFSLLLFGTWLILDPLIVHSKLHSDLV